MSLSLATLFVIGKATLFLAIPLALGLWELRRTRRSLAADRRGESGPSSIPGWLQAPRRSAPAPSNGGTTSPAPAAEGATSDRQRRAA